jgi:hypothetical protein
MTEGRKPRRRTAIETAEPQVESAEVETTVPQPEPQTAANEAAAADGGDQGQLSLQVFAPAADADEPAEELDDLDEPENSADLLVSISHETLAGEDDTEEDEAEETGPAEAGEWVYPGQPATAAADGKQSGEDGAPYEAEPDVGPEEGRLEIRMADLDATPMPYVSSGASPVDQPALQMRLARIHLRTGALFMARAELESLAARQQLDTPAHLDLAEARWRTGDLQGAGEAAAAYLADGGHEALGFVISAEAFALANRLDDARQHAAYALERHLSELDPVFAGMPRRASWPASAWRSAGPATTASAQVAVMPPVVEPAPPAAAPAEAALEPESVAASAAEPLVAPEPEAEAAPEPVPVAEAAPEPAPEPEAASAPAFEPEPAAEAKPDLQPEPVPEPEPAAEAAPEPEPEPTPEPVPMAAESPVAPEAPAEVAGAVAEVESGRACLRADDPMMAALHFGVAIRVAPVSAKSVLEAIGDRQELPLQLVRGDALRLLGLEADAGSAYLSVASALGAGRAAAESVVPALEEPPAPPAPAPPAPAAPVEPAPTPGPGPVEPPPLRWE